MKPNILRKWITAALMAALSCVATFIIHIPTPINGGYIHPGDTFVLLSGVILGPFYGGLAAGIGSMFADIFVGYAYWWVTFIVKALAAVVAALVYKHIRIKSSIIIAGIFGEIVVTLGYFLFECLVYGAPSAATEIPLNLVQNVFGIVLATLLLPLLLKVPQIKDMIRD